MTILSTADDDAIRAALGVDSAALPDATIALFLASADREVKRLVAGWASLTGDDLAALTTAAIYLTAERIALATPATTEVAGLGYKIVSKGVSAATLRALAYAELEGLGVVLTQSYGFSVPSRRSDGYTAVEDAL